MPGSKYEYPDKEYKLSRLTVHIHTSDKLKGEDRVIPDWTECSPDCKFYRKRRNGAKSFFVKLEDGTIRSATICPGKRCGVKTGAGNGGGQGGDQDDGSDEDEEMEDVSDEDEEG